MLELLPQEKQIIVIRFSNTWKTTKDVEAKLIHLPFDTIQIKEN